MIVQQITEDPASVSLDTNKHIQLPEHDIRKVMMLALSVRNDLSQSKRATKFGSLQLPIEKLTFMIDELEMFLAPKDIDEYSFSAFKFIIPKRLLIHPKCETLLTQLETEILTYLCVNQDQLIERDDILNSIWGHSDFYTSRSLDVYIHRLRKYFAIEAKIKIETVHRRGFRFSIDSTEPFSGTSM